MSQKLYFFSSPLALLIIGLSAGLVSGCAFTPEKQFRTMHTTYHIAPPKLSDKTVKLVNPRLLTLPKKPVTIAKRLPLPQNKPFKKYENKQIFSGLFAPLMTSSKKNKDIVVPFHTAAISPIQNNKKDAKIQNNHQNKPESINELSLLEKNLNTLITQKKKIDNKTLNINHFRPNIKNSNNQQFDLCELHYVFINGDYCQPDTIPSSPKAQKPRQVTSCQETNTFFDPKYTHRAAFQFNKLSSNAAIPQPNFNGVHAFTSEHDCYPYQASNVYGWQAYLLQGKALLSQHRYSPNFNYMNRNSTSR